MCDCSRFSSFDRFSADVDAGFRPCPPFFQPVSSGPTDIQQTTFAISTGFQMVFNTGSLAVSTDFQQVVFSRLCWQFFNRFSTGCDCLAVEFSHDDGNRRHKRGGGEQQGAIIKKLSLPILKVFVLAIFKEKALAIVYARTAVASVSARGEVMVELRRNGT